jgi:hypothetical protein
VTAVLAVLLLPLAGLAILFGAGLGVADLLGRRLPAQARAALAAPLSAAVLTSASPLAQLGLRPSQLALVVIGLLGLVTLARARRLEQTVRRAGAPLLVAVLALALSSAPAIRHQTSAVAGFGNGDPYYWVSQARALSHGPVSAPARLYPDRVAFDLISISHSPVALPVGLAQVAALGGKDPVDAYEAFGSLIFALLAVGVFFVARGCLHWRSRLATAAGVFVSANGYLLFASYNGWQAQLTLTAFGTLAVMTLPACFDRKALGRERLLPAIFMAASIATYGWLFAVFAGLGLAVALACTFTQIRSSVGRRRMVWTLGAVAGLGLILGFVPTVNAVRALSVSRGNGQANAAELANWSTYSWAFPSDALGLIVREIDLKSPGTGWVVLALAVAIALFAVAATRIRTFRNPRGLALAAACTALLGGLLLLGLKGSSPYLSMKLMGYGAPLFTLFALSIFAGRRARPRRITVIAMAAVVLFCLTSLLSLSVGIVSATRATAFQSIVAATASLPRSSVIRIDYPDVWHQVWLIYFLRERRLAVPDPTIYLEDVEYNGAKPVQFDAPASYAIGPTPQGTVLWSQNGMYLYALH